MGTMLLSGRGERAFQIGCLRSCRFGGVGLLPGCLEKLPGVEQNMAWAAHWFEQAGIQSSFSQMQPSERSSHRPSGSPARTRRCSVQLGLDAPRHQPSLERFSRQNIPSFLFQCLLASLSILLDFGWLCYDCSILFSKGFRKAKTAKRGKDLRGGRFWQRKQHCLAALQVLLPRLESGDGVPEGNAGIFSQECMGVFWI